MYFLTGPERRGEAQQQVAEGRHFEMLRRSIHTGCFRLQQLATSASGTPRKSRATTQSNQSGRWKGNAQTQWGSNALNKPEEFFFFKLRSLKNKLSKRRRRSGILVMWIIMQRLLFCYWCYCVPAVLSRGIWDKPYKNAIKTTPNSIRWANVRKYSTCAEVHDDINDRKIIIRKATTYLDWSIGWIDRIIKQKRTRVIVHVKNEK